MGNIFAGPHFVILNDMDLCYVKQVFFFFEKLYKTLTNNFRCFNRERNVTKHTVAVESEFVSNANELVALKVHFSSRITSIDKHTKNCVYVHII